MIDSEAGEEGNKVSGSVGCGDVDVSEVATASLRVGEGRCGGGGSLVRPSHQTTASGLERQAEVRRSTLFSYPRGALHRFTCAFAFPPFTTTFAALSHENAA
uniref:Uncharacterized protein n=1 Tax=Plectus sambesii TaxID=2011161 RepID=A0A914XI32_9BILA